MRWSPGFSHPSLPSPDLLAHYGAAVERHLERAEGLSEALREVLLDGLGDLALWWALKPLRAWQGKREDLARAIAVERAWLEATAIVEVGARVGLLVGAGARDSLRPVEPGLCLWLAARRVATTLDRDGLMDHRLNGALFDVFAMAAAMLEAPERSAGVVGLMAASEGPFEDLLELAPALAAAAVAWGARVEPELRAALTARALRWVQPMGLDWAREVGTALLVRECQRPEEREQLVQVALEVTREIVAVVAEDGALLESQALLATLETALCMQLAGARDGALAAAERLRQALPVELQARVGAALAQVMAPGAARDEALVVWSRALPDAAMARVLASCDLASPEVERRLAELAQSATLWEVLREAGRCPQALVPALLEVVRGGRPELRVRAAAALACSGAALGEVVAELERYFVREDLSAEETAGAVGAALWLGAAHPRLVPAALALMASELPAALTQALAEAVDHGLRVVPGHAEELRAFFATFAERAGVAEAVVKVGNAAAVTSQRARDLGAFAEGAPAPEALVSVLLTLAADSAEPLRSAEAAVACASLMQGDEALVQALVTLRAGASEPRVRALYDLALGASRALTPDVFERLGRDAATAAPEVAAAACVALRLGVETFVQASSLDAWVPKIRARVDEKGAHAEQALHLLAHLVTTPLGGDPRSR